MLKPIVSVLMLTVAVPALADQAAVTRRASTRFGALRAQSDPYGRLFAPQKTGSQPAIERQSAAKRKVVCGMTIIAADPKSDPLMVLEPNADGIDHSMRALDPPICNPR